MPQTTTKRLSQRALALLLLICVTFYASAAGDLGTRFSNQGSIANTRHNMTQRQPGGGGPNGVTMDQYRSDYGEICVYCHTPHGANTAYRLPLWNRTVKPTTYQLYSSTQMTQNVTQPGLNSIACLSCHDGQVAIDSVINMPGSGRFLQAQETVQDDGFLNTWTNPSGLGPGSHMKLTECMACHSPGAGALGAGATDFTAFVIGTDLRNDHPVGVTYPAVGPNVDFRAPSATVGNVRFFDANGNGRADKNEIRLYDTGEGFEVECATCHDPHGVPASGNSGPFTLSFLRVPNTSSAVCLTCHVK
jgi:hypothetical protein